MKRGCKKENERATARLWAGCPQRWVGKMNSHTHLYLRTVPTSPSALLQPPPSLPPPRGAGAMWRQRAAGAAFGRGSSCWPRGPRGQQERSLARRQRFGPPPFPRAQLHTEPSFLDRAFPHMKAAVSPMAAAASWLLLRWGPGVELWILQQAMKSDEKLCAGAVLEQGASSPWRPQGSAGGVPMERPPPESAPMARAPSRRGNAHLSLGPTQGASGQPRESSRRRNADTVCWWHPDSEFSRPQSLTGVLTNPDTDVPNAPGHRCIGVHMLGTPWTNI